MGYALEGSARPATVTRDGDLVDTIGVDGVALTATGRSHRRERPGSGAATRGQPGGHSRRCCSFSNYNNRIGDFDEPRAHRMLTSARKRTACGEGAGPASRRVRRRADRPRVAAAPRHARAWWRSRGPYDGRSEGAGPLSMAFMASGNARGYAARGYELTGLSRRARRGGADDLRPARSVVGPGPIAAMRWVREELRYFVTRVAATKVDLGSRGLRLPVGRGLAAAHRPAGPAPGRVSGAVWSARRRRVARHPPGRPHASGGTTRARSTCAARVAVDQGLHGLAIWQIGSSGRLQP